MSSCILHAARDGTQRKQDCSRITRTGQEYAQYDFPKGEHNIILVGLFFLLLSLFARFTKCTWRAGAETFVLSFHSAGSCPRCMACCCCCYCCQLSNLTPLSLSLTSTHSLSFYALSASASEFESCLKSEKTSATRRR